MKFETQEAPMRSLILLTAAVVMLGCNPSFAQQVGSARMRNAPGTMSSTATTLPTMSRPAPALGTIPLLSARPGSPLGAFQSGAGTSASIAPGAIGTVTTCAAAGSGATTSSGIIDASSAVGISGALATPVLPGATVPANLAFAPSIGNGTCNPAASTQNLTEFFNNTEVAPIPGLATITAGSYSDATIPSAATEAGASGLSPEIIVPSVSPCVGTTTVTTATVNPSGLAMPSSTVMPATSSLLSPPAC
jgi:hypothetical protein